MNKIPVTIDEHHVYRDGERVVPGVTGIIRAAGLMDVTGFNDYARDRGTAVHKAIELYERGTLDVDSLDEVITPYLIAWQAFKADTNYETEATEQIVSCNKYQYAGTLDNIGILDGLPVLIDYKTGIYQPWWSLQTSAYNQIAKRRKRFSLELHDTGKYRLIEHNDKRDFQRFLACLTVAGIKSEWGMK